MNHSSVFYSEGASGVLFYGDIFSHYTVLYDTSFVAIIIQSLKSLITRKQLSPQKEGARSTFGLKGRTLVNRCMDMLRNRCQPSSAIDRKRKYFYITSKLTSFQGWRTPNMSSSFLREDKNCQQRYI